MAEKKKEAKLIICKIRKYSSSSDESNTNDELGTKILSLIKEIYQMKKKIPVHSDYETMMSRFQSFSNSSINTLERKIELANSGLFCQKKNELLRESYICFCCSACFYNLEDNLVEGHSECHFSDSFYNPKENKLSFFDEYLIDISDRDANFIKSRIKLSPLYLRQLTEYLRDLDTLEYNKYDFIDDEFFSCIQNSELYGYFVPIETEGDGNCLYKAISLLIIGDQNCFSLIKLSVLFILFEYEEYFRNILNATNPEYSFEKLIEDTAQTNSWGNEYTQLAISIVFNRPLNIYIFNSNNQPTYIHQFCVNNNQVNAERSINLAHKIHHFVALSPVDHNFVSTHPKTNQFIEDFELENVITYKN